MVHWKWGASEAEGKIAEKHEEDTMQTIKGKEVKRKASKEEPVYTIEQEDGTRFLKSESELIKGKKK